MPGAPARRTSQGGYAMAVLLVVLAIMGVALSVAMPAWRTVVQREKEEELIFRGRQYARAIGLFQRRFANAYPPSFDVLVEQKFLRKKFKDPMTEDGEFQVLYQGSAAALPGGRGTQPGMSGRGGAGPQGGVIGVASKSTDKSFRILDGRSQYNEWRFIWQSAASPGRGGGANQPGGRGGGANQPGVRGGGRGGQPGLPGQGRGGQFEGPGRGPGGGRR